MAGLAAVAASAVVDIVVVVVVAEMEMGRRKTVSSSLDHLQRAVRRDEMCSPAAVAVAVAAAAVEVGGQMPSWTKEHLMQ